MTETILKALVRLFALIGNMVRGEAYAKTRSIVESYLHQQMSTEQVMQYLTMFDFLYQSLKPKLGTPGVKKIASYSVKILTICEKINEELTRKQKMLLLLELLEIVKYAEEVDPKDLEYVRTVSDSFKIKKEEFLDCKAFIHDGIEKIPCKDKVLIIGNLKKQFHVGFKSINREYLKGKIHVIYLANADSYVFRYLGEEEEIYLNQRLVLPNQTYVFEKGGSLRGPKISPVYYSDVVGRYLLDLDAPNVEFLAKEISFRFNDGSFGIHPMSFSAKSGQIIGVMGGSGVGKSTFLNLLNGNLQPTTGNIYINGNDFNRQKEKSIGLIGYIPQEDFLIEELTVFDNLCMSARLCFDNLSLREIKDRVRKTLIDLDLFEIRNFKIGSPLNKFISGGQRKRLNIALELVREPHILFVDEPTSGLSSADSEKVMDLLKEQALKGKLVVVNIHQPSSGIFKLFDRILLLDKGGYSIYFGNPLDAIVYFKTMGHFVNASVSECKHCGNVNTEQIFQIVESKEVNEDGDFKRKRLVSPKLWYEMYQKKIESGVQTESKKRALPPTLFQIPGKLKQFGIYFLRNTKTKFADKGYLIINFFEAPLLALILSVLTKYFVEQPGDHSTYLYSENVNIPAYLFMSVVVALFIGMMVSAEEIIKDGKILQRESFLNLSRTSYLNSKVIYLIFLSAFQMFVYVFIGNKILGIKGLMSSSWLILFSVAFFANMLGLNISSGMKTVVSIYILIPLLLVPQLLLSGTIVKFDKLNRHVNSLEYTPFIGDVMASRWAYEAFVVNLFKNNEWERHFYELERSESDAAYKVNYYFPELISNIDDLFSNGNTRVTPGELASIRKTLLFEIHQLNKDLPKKSDLRLPENMGKMDSSSLILLKEHIEDVRQFYFSRLDHIQALKDAKMATLSSTLPVGLPLDRFKQQFYNNSLADLALDKNEPHKIIRHGNKIIRLFEPVFMEPSYKTGRAHFYAPCKKLGNWCIDTLWFNVFVIWLMTLFLYFTLLGDVLRKVMNEFSLLKVKIDERFIKRAGKDD
jgi:ABC transport system ATP-binding/permease protein